MGAGIGHGGGRAIGASVHRDRQAIAEYARWVEAEFGDYLIVRSEYYTGERRWPRSPFWGRGTRRRAPSRELRAVE